MKREEAIKLLICEKACVEDVDDNIGGERVRQAYDMAIEALSVEPTDLISRTDAIKAIESRQTEQWIDADVDYNNGLESAVAEIKALPSAEQVTGKLNNPCDSLLKADSESCKEQKSKLDLISRADALEQMAQAECGVHYEDCEADNCACPYIGRILDIPPAESNTVEWIPVSEGLPKCEQEVLICTEKKLVGRDAYIDSIVTLAIYEDGTMSEANSMWHWEDIDFAEWDDEEDCGIIPEGWFENRHFNPDGEYNNPVDRKVVAWMSLPKPYRKDDEA